MRLTAIPIIGALLFTSIADAARTAVPNDEAAITHALNRLAFGPRPGEAARIRTTGLNRWIEQQLHPSQLADRELVGRLRALETIVLDPPTLARDYFIPARQARRVRQQTQATAAAPQEMNGLSSRPPTSEIARGRQRILSELSEAKLLRAVYSERQLEEVLVDFWFNHFNVFARKGQTIIYVGEHERDAIKPHVLGRFRDLLGATASSPAMLYYLDNWQSRQGALNENFARELLELHTLGVDGGYSQQDVENVARVFTGWTITRPEQAAFRFAPRLHDRGVKTVLGHTITGGGRDEGERVLDLLARHPATAKHVATKLAQRFVDDTPPPSVIERAAAVFRATDGDLLAVVRTIVVSPEFFSTSTRRTKIKTPLEYVVSALRASGADVRSGQATLRALADMGMPLYLCQPPTGYDETARGWISAGALVSRVNFAVALSRGQVRGVHVPSSLGTVAAASGAAEFQRQ